MIPQRNRVLTLWADALASGEYEQAKGGLRDNEGFCCLGVLCDLHRKDVTPEREWRGETYCGEFNHLPDEVLEWAGLTQDEVLEKDVGSFDVLFKDTEEDEYGDLQDVVYKASCLNDGIGSDDMSYPSESFDQIAVRVRAMVPSDQANASKDADEMMDAAEMCFGPSPTE